MRMKKSNILIVWSNYYKDLADKQLSSCVQLLKKTDYDFKVETVEAGTYEIPAVIRHYQQVNPFDGYIPLSLLLKGNTDHYEFIWEHVKECFIQLTMEGVLLGNGVISAPTLEILESRVEKGERVLEAFNAVRYLIELKQRSKG